MKSITRLSLALIMFFLFLISYLETSVSAETGMNPGMNRGMNPAINLDDESDMTWEMRGDHHEGPATFDDGLMGTPGVSPKPHPVQARKMVAPHLRTGGARSITGVGNAGQFVGGSQGKAGITLPQTGLTKHMNQDTVEQTPGAKPIADTILRNHAPTQAR